MAELSREELCELLGLWLQMGIPVFQERRSEARVYAGTPDGEFGWIPVVPLLIVGPGVSYEISHEQFRQRVLKGPGTWRPRGLGYVWHQEVRSNV